MGGIVPRGHIWKTMNQNPRKPSSDPDELWESARSGVQLGNRLRQQGKLTEAEASIEEALRLKPEFEDAHNALGVVLWGQGRMQEAEASYRRALEIAPDHVSAHNNLGMVQKDLGKMEEAAHSFRQALRFDPNYARAHYNLGNVLSAQDNMGEAEASYLRAVELKPDYTKAHNALGKVQLSLGKAEAAAASFRSAAAPTVAKLSRNNEHGISVLYTKNHESELTRLCDLHGSDKGEIDSNGNPYPWPSHTYTDFYELIFGQKRKSVREVLECGIGTNDPNLAYSMGATGKPGASLRMWRDYFPSANVIGIDIDPNILFSEDRIRTFEVDQTSSESIRSFLQKLDADLVLDIIVDDGLHEFRGGRSLFENLIDRLAEDGVYLIEDVNPSDLLRYDDYFNGLGREYYVRFVNLNRPRRPFSDNSLVMITRK